jgi:hypothetical protein
MLCGYDLIRWIEIGEWYRPLRMDTAPLPELHIDNTHNYLLLYIIHINEEAKKLIHR